MLSALLLFGINLKRLSISLLTLLFLSGTGLLHGQNDTLEKGFGVLVRTGCTIADSAILITGTGAVHSNKASFPGETTLDELDLNFRVQINALDASGDAHFMIGKHGGIAGTMVEFLATDSTSSIRVNRLNSLTPIFITEFVLPFVMAAGENYHIRIGKRVRALVIEVISSDSTNIFFNDSLSYPTPFFGCLWGKPFIGAHAGTIYVRDFSMTTPFSRTPRVMVMGDSFIEGNALTAPDDRYIKLLQDSIGDNNVTISGKGGEASGTVTTRFYTELGWFSGAKYVYVPIGVNDVNFSVWKMNMEGYLDTLKKLDLIPIVATLSPRSDRLPFIAAANNWIRTVYNGAYIDVSKAISPAGTTWGTGLGMSDSVHPTIAGHLKIYERMQIEAPYLFRASDPYTIDFVNETTVEPVDNQHEFDVLSSFATASIGALTSIPVVPGQTVFFRDTTDTPGIHTIFHILQAPKRPAAPTNPGVSGGGFDWTDNPLFVNVSDYEYSADSGTTWFTCPSKPLVSTGVMSVFVRVKATLTSFKSDALFIEDLMVGIADAGTAASWPKMEAFPNPVSDVLTIQNVVEPSELSVFSVDGKLLMVVALENESSRINTSELGPGFYIFSVNSRSGQQNFRILKK